MQRPPSQQSFSSQSHYCPPSYTQQYTTAPQQQSFNLQGQYSSPSYANQPQQPHPQAYARSTTGGQGSFGRTRPTIEYPDGTLRVLCDYCAQNGARTSGIGSRDEAQQFAHELCELWLMGDMYVGRGLHGCAVARLSQLLGMGERNSSLQPLMAEETLQLCYEETPEALGCGHCVGACVVKAGLSYRIAVAVEGGL
ncbi:hypothetical protein LTR85_007364 [Meristemomyces frigidus]|nr:hypothetical protein LTR85_007364 [Meristemomyces frigidus]